MTKTHLTGDMSFTFGFRPILAVLLFLCAVFPVFAEEHVLKPGEQINLERCLEIALKMHPSIMSSRYSVRAREAQLGQARAGYFPKIDTSASYTKNYVEKDRHDPNYALTYGDQNVFSASASQTIYDFGRVGTEVKGRRLDLDSSRFDLDDVATTVTNNVKQAYYGVLKAKRSKTVNDEVVAQYREHLSRAKVFFEAGTKPKYDVTKAELDLSNAQLELINAENDLRVAWVTLNNAMGFGEMYEYEVDDSLASLSFDMTFEDALEKAYRNRPDLKSLVAQKDSAVVAADLARKEYYPKFTGLAAYNFLGSQYPLGETWNAGIAMSMNLFEGFRTQNKVEEARARSRSIGSKVDSLRLQILLEIKKAYLGLQLAKEKIANTEIQVRQSTENLELARLRYNSGLADPLEVTDATVSYSKARLANISALYDYRIAQAGVEKAIGNR